MIKVEGLCVTLGEFALEDINLTVEDGEYFVILGPTAAGKTVLLESIAGLNPVSRGRIFLRNRDITHEKPEKRGVSIVYQDHALFPHLSVRENIVFGLRLHRKTEHEMNEAQKWLAALLGIPGLLHRKPQTLSGGERQKVALARALSTRPEVLLLDEPLSALDPETRETVQEELQRLHAVLKNTIVHVTHDFEEAMALGGRVAVIAEGRLKQVGTPEEIFRRPESEFVARFTLMRNIFAGKVEPRPDGGAVFRTGDIELITGAYKEGAGHAGVRPDDIRVLPANPARIEPNTLTGTITRISNKGMDRYVTVSVPPDFCCLVNKPDFTGMELREGKQVQISFEKDSVHLF